MAPHHVAEVVCQRSVDQSPRLDSLVVSDQIVGENGWGRLWWVGKLVGWRGEAMDGGGEVVG